jgi:hypothetical protein
MCSYGCYATWRWSIRAVRDDGTPKARRQREPVPPGLIDARQWQHPLQNGAEADQHHEQLEKLG